MSPDDPRHGTTRGYHAGCRELCCRRAYARYEKRGKVRRARGEIWKLSPLGAQRRIQALMALGWTSTDIAHAAGWAHRNAVQRILDGQNGKPCQYLERKTHAAICEVFERLSMQIPPHAPHRARTRTMARKRGYAPPLAWDDIDDPNARPHGHHRPTDDDIDPVVVMRLLEGERVPSTRAEKEAAMTRWVADGAGSRNELARMHGWKSGRYAEGLRLVQGGAA